MGLAITAERVKMKEAMAAAGLREPTFEPDGFFRAIFNRSPKYALKEGSHGSERTTHKTAQDAAQNTAQKIIALIAQKPDVTRQELAKAIGITDSGVKYHLKKMQEKKLIRRVGPDKGGHWEVVRCPI